MRLPYSCDRPTSADVDDARLGLCLNWRCFRDAVLGTRHDAPIVGQRHSRALFSGSAASRRMRSSADCIITACESEFSVHTTGHFG